MSFLEWPNNANLVLLVQDGKSQICFLAREDSQFPEVISNHNLFSFFTHWNYLHYGDFQISAENQASILKVLSLARTWQEEESSNPPNLQWIKIPQIRLLSEVCHVFAKSWVFPINPTMSEILPLVIEGYRKILMRIKTLKTNNTQLCNQK